MKKSTLLITLFTLLTVGSIANAQETEAQHAERIAEERQVFLTNLAQTEGRDDVWASVTEEYITNKFLEEAVASNQTLLASSVECFTSMCIYEIQASDDCGILAFGDIISSTLGSIGGNEAIVELSLSSGPTTRDALHAAVSYRNYGDCHQKGVIGRLSENPEDFPAVPTSSDIQ